MIKKIIMKNFEIKFFSNINFDNNINNLYLNDYYNNKKIKSYCIDKRYKEVFTTKKEGNEFYAIVIFDNNETLEKKIF